MSLSDYLAKNYLTADKSSEKKGKKRKRKEASAGLTIADDDIAGWTAGDNGGRERAEDGSTIVFGQSAEFRKSSKNNWKSVSNSDQAAADAILASAAEENLAASTSAAADDTPTVVHTDTSVQKMADGTHAGLQSAEQVAAALAQRQAEEHAQLAQQGGVSTEAQETIYRDASGRIINVALKRAEARRAAAEEARKEQEEREARQGDVQREEKAERKRELEDAKYMTVARHADDAALNAELRERDRWNDPAAGFLARKREAAGGKKGRPVYKGGFEPNRYGIRPGHRWDGVDRGNGFERKYFAARNQRESVKGLEYAWQMDE